jgi:thiol-disulfide isomerase/thioredoxin
MNANKLTKRPALLTAVLSLATLAGYAGYRWTTLPGTDPEASFHNELPEIALNDLNGTPAPLAQFADKALLINFWATWCAPCLREIPLLKEFHAGHDQIDVVGIAVDRLDPVLEYAADMEFNYPVLVGASGVAEAYDAMAFFRNEAQVMPFSAFVAPGGAILGVKYGELHTEHLDLVVATLAGLDSGQIGLDQAREALLELLEPL